MKPKYLAALVVGLDPRHGYKNRKRSGTLLRDEVNLHELRAFVGRGQHKSCDFFSGPGRVMKSKQSLAGAMAGDGSVAPTRPTSDFQSRNLGAGQRHVAHQSSVGHHNGLNRRGSRSRIDLTVRSDLHQRNRSFATD